MLRSEKSGIGLYASVPGVGPFGRLKVLSCLDLSKPTIRTLTLTATRTGASWAAFRQPRPTLATTFALRWGPEGAAEEEVAATIATGLVKCRAKCRVVAQEDRPAEEEVAPAVATLWERWPVRRRLSGATRTV